MVEKGIKNKYTDNSHQEDWEDTLEYADACSEGSYHTPKVAEENTVPLPVPEPSLLAVDQPCPLSDQENILPRAAMPPPLNVLVPIMEEEPARVNDCCRRALVIRSQTCIKSDGRRLSHPYRRPAPHAARLSQQDHCHPSGLL